MANALFTRIARAEGMPSPGARVLVACSGGADSTALLHILHGLGHDCVVAHLDHAARAESGADADFVRQQAHALGLPFVSERHDVAALAQESGRSFEMQARETRYGFLVRSARAHGCAAIATGHTRSDQAETVLMRILRGTGPGGLAGIPPVGAWDGLPVCRPLLDCTREELRGYLRENNLPWREDASNASPEYLRNRIRNDLLPALQRDYNPEVEHALARLADLCRKEDECLRAMAAGAEVVTEAGVARQPFAQLHRALQHRVLMQWMATEQLPADFDMVGGMAEHIRTAPTGACLSLPGGRLLYAGRNHAMLLPEESPRPQETILSVPGEATLCGRHFVARMHSAAPQPLATHCNAARQWLAAEAVGDALELRTWLPGDRIAPLGMGGTRKVADILAESGMPRPQRAQWPLLVKNGEVLWIPGGPVSQMAAINNAASPAVEVEIFHAVE